MMIKTIHPEAFMWASELQLQNIARTCAGLDLRTQEPLSRHTSFRTGGPAALMAFPRTPEELQLLLRSAAAEGVEPYLLGAGTNVLAPDAGLQALVICLKDALTGIRPEGQTGLQVFAGESLARTAVFAKNHALTGLEFAHGIPGTLGGGVYMNAGAYGGEMKQVVTSVTVFRMDGTEQTLSAEASAFGYRTSVFQHTDGVIVRACFALQPGDPGIIRETMRELMTRRTVSQPLDLPSAGSAFKRPQGGYAAALIESAGLKGLTVGGAQVSEKHAGFVVNRGGATAADVLELLRQVQQRVLEHSGIRLEPEIRLWD